MKTKTLLIIILCLILCIPSFAEDEDIIIGSTQPGEIETDVRVSETPTQQPTQQEQQPAQQPPKQEQQPAQQQEDAPATTSDGSSGNNGGSSGGGGGYASPIVNIEAIEVPLGDGTSIVLPFLDVPQDAYYTAAVAWAYSNDITGGVADDRFDPLATCTRSQMVTFLWRAAGSPEPTGTASGFSDVAAGSWYEKAVAWAVENKITDGVGDGRFDPNGIVNRAQAVTFLYRAKGAPETAASESFTDVASGAWYENAVAWAVANEITNGVGDNAFAPNNNCVRGQTVTFLYRAYK